MTSFASPRRRGVVGGTTARTVERTHVRVHHDRHRPHQQQADQQRANRKHLTAESLSFPGVPTILECKSTSKTFSYDEVYDDHHDKNAQQHDFDVLGPVGSLDLPGLPLEVYRLPTDSTSCRIVF